MATKKRADGSFKIGDFEKLLTGSSSDELINSEQLITLIEQSFVNAYRKYVLNDPHNKNASVNDDVELECEIISNKNRGKIKLYQVREVCYEDDITDDFLQVSIEYANNSPLNTHHKKYKIGDKFREEIDIEPCLNDKAFLLRLTSAMRQMKDKIVNENIVNDAKKHEGSIMRGKVKSIEGREDQPIYILDFGRYTAPLLSRFCIGDEKFKEGDEVEVYVTRVDNVDKNSIPRRGHSPVLISRTDPNFVKALLNTYIREVHDGDVSVISVVRDPGVRCKAVVKSNNPNIDAVGACVGTNSSRAIDIINRINNEKIDFIPYEENFELRVANSLLPCQIVGVKVEEDSNNPTRKVATVICANGEKAKALGQKQSNILLAMRLVNCKIVVYELDEAMSQHIQYDSVSVLKNMAKGISTNELINISPNLTKTLDELDEDNISEDVDEQEDSLEASSVSTKENEVIVNSEQTDKSLEEIAKSVEKKSTGIATVIKKKKQQIQEETKQAKVASEDQDEDDNSLPIYSDQDEDYDEEYEDEDDYEYSSDDEYYDNLYNDDK